MLCVCGCDVYIGLQRHSHLVKFLLPGCDWREEHSPSFLTPPPHTLPSQLKSITLDANSVGNEISPALKAETQSSQKPGDWKQKWQVSVMGAGQHTNAPCMCTCTPAAREGTLCRSSFTLTKHSLGLLILEIQIFVQTWGKRYFKTVPTRFKYKKNVHH